MLAFADDLSVRHDLEPVNLCENVSTLKLKYK